MTPQQLQTYKKLLGKISGKNLTMPEDRLTHNVAHWLRGQVLDGWPIVFFHVPNECYATNKKQLLYSRKLDKIGRIPGAPDFVISSKQRTVYLELKAPESKKQLSENQQAFKAWADSAGVPYYMASSLPEVRKIIFKEFSGIADFSVLSD